MKNKIKTLAKFLIDINSAFRKSSKHSKKKPSFISNNISIVQQHSEEIQRLANQCNWTLLEMKPRYNAETNSMSPHMYFLGIANGTECETVDDFLS